MVRLLRLLDEPRDRAVLAPLVKREILWRLITGEQGATVRQLGLADSSLSHISRAVRWIREHYAQPFRVEDVARQSGMGVSAFYRNFQAVTAMSPIQFQKQIRLQEARLLLATHPGDVTGVGHRVGYDNPSQFSREYRRRFGVPPSQDAARLRRGVRAPGLSCPEPGGLQLPVRFFATAGRARTVGGWPGFIRRAAAIRKVCPLDITAVRTGPGRSSRSSPMSWP